jgi:cell division transport system permease protein
MSEKTLDKFAISRVRTSFITTVISISLVLFMLGLLGIVILYARKISEYVKENMGFTIIMNDNTRVLDVINLQKYLSRKKYVKRTEFISKEKAATDLKTDLGEDFIKFLGYNPLSPSIEVRLRAGYVNPDSLKFIEKVFTRNKNVKEVIYQKPLLHLVNQNVKRVGLIMLVFSSLLLFIAVVLINNTIRLAIYSRRFIIKSMMLIGATQAFIRRPFIIKGILQGIYGAILAILMLIGVIYLGHRQIPELAEFTDYNLLSILFGLIVLLGIIITWISNYLAVRKYLKLKTDFLYYQ